MHRLHFGTLTLMLLSSAAGAGALGQESKPQQLKPSQQKLAAEAKRLTDEAIELYRSGKLGAAVAPLRLALEVRQKLYPAADYPDGHVDLAESQHNLGMALYEMGSFEAALGHFERALAMRQKLYSAAQYPDGHPDLATSLNNLGGVLLARTSYEKALSYFEQALAVNRKLYPAAKFPDGHPALALSLGNIGLALKEMDALDKAQGVFEQTLAMQRKLYPQSEFPAGHPALAVSLLNVGIVLERAGAVAKALPYFESSLAIYRKLYPPSTYPEGHPDLASGLNNLGTALIAAGDHERALPLFEQALAMRRRFYPASNFPDGHPELAMNLSNLGAVLVDMELFERARPLHAEALAMRRHLYPASKFPDGHPGIAESLNNLGALWHKAGAPEKALPLHEEALAMRRKLFPVSMHADGHPDLAFSLVNVGVVLEEAGLYDRALPIYEQALAMYRRLYPAARYPDGHPKLAGSLNNMGYLLRAKGATDKALPYFQSALAMYRALERRALLSSSEAEALSYLAAQPTARDSYLSAALEAPNTAASAYGVVWQSKAAVSRMLELRHAAARAAGTQTAAQLTRLKEVRRRIDQLLQNQGMPITERDPLLAKATDDRDKLERELAKALPMLQRAAELDAPGPEALGKWLPDHAVLIDIVRYTRLEQDRTKPGNAGETRTPSYAAFVVGRTPVAHAPGSPAQIKRIELGAVEAIDGAVAYWREAIESRRATSAAAKPLHDLVWAKLKPHVPAGIKTLYLAPDGDLARVPWAALPIGKERLLLEDYAIATAPHGPFLLEQWQHPRQFSGPEWLLTVGDVDYNSQAWPPLAGSKAEIAALMPLAPGKGESLSQSEASPARLAQALPRARFAHLATHGEFQAKKFAAEQERVARAMATRRFGDDTRRVALKNPLGYVGLVLSGGEVISGLSILDLNLDNLKLVTLSACETGLGEYTGGKGVENLQMAFHVAGCPNVVASLWKVNDAATAALMTKFYHEMWVNKKPPIEALREAQLTIYRHPDLIPALAGERGRPELDKALRVGEPSRVSGRVADTKLWAAFVLSGPGK